MMSSKTYIISTVVIIPAYYLHKFNTFILFQFVLHGACSLFNLSSEMVREAENHYHFQIAGN